MRKEKNKRGKNPRGEIIQRVKIPETKIVFNNFGTPAVVKNDHKKAGRNILIHHFKVPK